MSAQALSVERLSEQFGVATPVESVRRLSAETRRLAVRFLSGEMGLAMRPAGFEMIPGSTDGMSPDRAYAEVVMRIAEAAPLRILDEERLVGAATLLEATQHATPVVAYPSTSHTTLGFGPVLKEGYGGLRRRIEARLAGEVPEEQKDFLMACRRCLDAAGVWQDRHLAELRQRIQSSTGLLKRHYEEVLAVAHPVPEQPATTFREAVQSLWFAWSFQRLCGNWSGIGRIDKLLGPFLQRDLDRGAITLEEAREWLAHFWIKGCEWIGCGEFKRNSGDAQFYQNIVLGGVDEEGRPVLNAVTDLVLDVVEELHISDFPIAVRVGRDTPDRLLRRIAEVQRRGGGIVAIYNDEVIIRALTRFGYPLAEARDYANDGCWEILIPGRTAFGYFPFDLLMTLQETLGLGPENNRPANFPDFESLYRAFTEELAGPRFLGGIHTTLDERFIGNRPSPLVSLLVEDCIEKGRGYHNRGARYTVQAPHAGGMPDTANSLLAIKKWVYDEKRFTLEEFIEILRTNWRDQEALRQEIRQKTVFYGNDDSDADAMMKRIYEDYVTIGGQVRERNGVLRPLGISTFGREIAFRAHRKATAFGACEGETLASNLAPTPGTDRKGPTAVIRSFCALDFERLPNGVPLELKILPASVAGEKGLDILVALMRTFIQLGGMFLHIDVVDSELLKEAQAHPERYPNLSVRISGWSARFATLARDWQNMIIQRTQQRV